MIREEAIELLKDLNNHIPKYDDAINMAISALEQPEPCEDAVSRKEVSEWLKQYGQDVLHGKYKFSLMYIWKKLMELPSVTPKPKTGKWLDIPDGYKCSECGAYLEIDCGDAEMNYCPNCGSYNGGARLEGAEQDG